MNEDVTLRETTLTLQQGDIVVLLTDGVTECADENGAMFGEDRVRQLLAETRVGPREAAERVLEAIDRFRGAAPLQDDVTCAFLRYLGRMASPVEA